jgi:hypothetical protein
VSDDASQPEGDIVEIDKQQVIEFLKSQGDHDKAGKADAELPDKVDPDAHADLLKKIGVNPGDLLGKLPGGLGKLGGFGG